MNQKITTYTLLNTTAIKNGWGVSLRFYYLLRYLDVGGCGKLIFSETVDSLSELLHQSKQNVRTILRNRGGIFWHVYDKKIYIHSAEKAVDALGLECLGNRVAFSEQELCSSLTKFKARMVYSIAAKDSTRSFDISRSGKIIPRGGKIIARDTITGLSGCSKSTQRRYESKIHVQKMWTFGYCKVTEANWDRIPIRDGGIYEQRGQSLEDIDGDGINELVWQCPNRYTVDMDYIGKTRRIRSHLISPSQANHSPRVYYDNTRSASKAIEQGRISNSGLYTIRKVKQNRILMKYTPGENF